MCYVFDRICWKRKEKQTGEEEKLIKETSGDVEGVKDDLEVNAEKRREKSSVIVEHSESAEGR